MDPDENSGESLAGAKAITPRDKTSKTIEIISNDHLNDALSLPFSFSPSLSLKESLSLLSLSLFLSFSLFFAFSK